MTTKTTLVHRAYSGPLEWWRDGLVYEAPFPELGAADLETAGIILEHAASLGFRVVLVRPSLVDIGTADLGSFDSFTTAAHERNLRVIARISGALGPVTGPRAHRDHPIITGAERDGDGLLERARAFLSAGADGVDLGMIVPPEVDESTDLEALTEYLTVLQGLVAEHVEDGIIGADVSADYPETLRHHLQDDWLHHLRDDSLMLVRWDHESITDHLTHSLAEHDRFGAPPAWRCLPSYRLIPENDPGGGRAWFSAATEERRRRSIALQVLMLALPGAVYLRQGDEINLLDRDKPPRPLALAETVAEHARTQAYQFGSPLATVRQAVHVRGRECMANAPLAFVRGLEWCPQEVLTLLVRSVLVVVNTSDRAMILPEHAEVLLSSHSLEQREGRLLLPPTTTVWLRALTVA
ncbi:glycosidase [Actinomyces oricola]|uniref:glycosidase n=1 Tax=Actinomyces oricola TaxID=206043 RepID=UPI000FFE9289|nr:glycosidase [Actinomyces oricola]